MTRITTVAALAVLALSLGAASAFAETIVTPTAKPAAAASAKIGARAPARTRMTWETARGNSSRAAIDLRPDVPGYPPAQAAQ